MQAIQTRYLGPTNHRGARIKASAQAGSAVIGWNHALSPEDNHKAAAIAFVIHKKWHKKVDRIIGGQLPNGDYAWVMVHGK